MLPLRVRKAQIVVRREHEDKVLKRVRISSNSAPALLAASDPSTTGFAGGPPPRSRADFRSLTLGSRPGLISPVIAQAGEENPLGGGARTKTGGMA